ncbi:MAG: DNA alkylation repair protein [Candidatus Limnocylindrales bacterium]|jgi:3-methyladenine DNA glycosylase AlkD
MSPATTSAITAASNRFVAEHLADATALGEMLADLVHDPDAFVAAIEQGFETLADPAYADGSRSIAPGLGPILGVRLPLIEAAHKAFKRGTRKTSTSLLVDAMDRLLREELREIRWFGMWNLSRLLPTDPERTWQLLRRAAREADEWITVDTLAHPYGEGILGDARRWAELEQLVYSPSRWERRLVGSTIATMPHVRGVPGGRSPVVVERGMWLMSQLIGDAEPDVQKALSWALRTLAQLDPAATARFLEAEAEAARATDDGHRAWVIRDAVSKLPAESGTRLKTGLDGIRRRPGVPSTSRAAATAAAFLAAGAAPRAEDRSRRISAP